MRFIITDILQACAHQGQPTKANLSPILESNLTVEFTITFFIKSNESFLV